MSRLLRGLQIIAVLSIASFCYAQTGSIATNASIIEYIQNNILGTAAITIEDASQNYLELIFGDVNSNAGGIIPTMFRILNIGVSITLMLSLIYASAFGFSSMSSEGGMIGSGRASPFTVFRIVTGFALVIPTASGYSLIQKLVMNVIFAGILTANYGWELLLDNFENGVATATSVSVVGPTTPPASTILSTNIFEWNGTPANTNSIDFYQYDLKNGTGLSDFLNKLNYIIANSLYVLRPHLQAHASWFYQANPIYSIISVPSISAGVSKQTLSIQLDTIFPLVSGSQPYSLTLFDLEFTAPASNQARLTSFTSAVQSYLQRSINNYLGSYLSTFNLAPGALSGYNRTSTLNIYNATKGGLLSALPTTQSEPVLPDPWIDSARAWGWVGAGVYYLDFDRSLHQQDTQAVVPVTRTFWKPDTAILRSYADSDADTNDPCGDAFGASAEHAPYLTRGCIKSARILGTDTSARQLNVTWLRSLISLLNSDGQAPRPTLKIDSDSFKSKLKPSSAIDGFDLSNVTIGKGTPFNFETNIPLNIMGTLTNQVLDAVLGDEGMFSADNSRLGNPLRSAMNVGFGIMNAARTYWTDSRTQIFSEIKNIQDASYIASSVAIGAKSLIEGVAQKHKNRNPVNRAKNFNEDLGYRVAPGLVVDPVFDMVNIMTMLCKGLMSVYLPLGNGLATVYFVAGAILGVYIPIMPALIFLFSVIAWLFAAIEAMFASPLIAIGLTNPEGHEVMGRVEQAVMLLVGIFLRPILTLMGLMIGIFFAHIAVDLYNGIFLRLIPIYIYTLKDSALLNQELVRVFFASGLVVLYVYAMLVVIEQCYSMIYMIPDRVLRWIGGPQDSAGSGVGGALQSISAGLSQDTASAGQQTGGASSRAFSQDTSVKK